MKLQITITGVSAQAVREFNKQHGGDVRFSDPQEIDNVLRCVRFTADFPSDIDESTCGSWTAMVQDYYKDGLPGVNCVEVTVQKPDSSESYNETVAALEQLQETAARLSGLLSTSHSPATYARILACANACANTLADDVAANER